MELTEKQVIKNAIATAKRDGYGQIVYIDDEDGRCSFSRDYPLNNMYKKENVLGKVVVGYKLGVQTVKYIKQ